MWEALEFLLGSWAGTGSGEPGTSTVQRSYELVLGGKFIYARNRSSYAPQERNPSGEVHEDWGLLSYDRSRKLFVLRQFHGEGFVNQYIQQNNAPQGPAIVFVSEQIENIAAGWRARESYEVHGADEFSETFELAGPGQDFAVYSTSLLRRVGR